MRLVDGKKERLLLSTLEQKPDLGQIIRQIAVKVLASDPPKDLVYAPTHLAKSKELRELSLETPSIVTDKAPLSVDIWNVILDFLKSMSKLERLLLHEGGGKLPLR